MIELHVAADDRSRAMDALAKVSGEATFEPSRQSIRLPAADGSQTLLAVVRRLDETGIAAQDIALHKPTLDDVFLTLTGRGAAAAEAERASPKKPKRGRRQEGSAA